VLRRPSTDRSSSREDTATSSLSLTKDPSEGDDRECWVTSSDDFDAICPGCNLALEPACPLESGELTLRPSFVRFERGLPPETVCALDGRFLFAASAVSEMISAIGRGLRAWATASGPAQWANAGQPTLARTKLPRTVTGRTLSVIFSCLAASDTPKQMCCTLFSTLRHVLKASVWGFGARSCKYVWKYQNVCIEGVSAAEVHEQKSGRYGEPAALP
jgi:hypothetical protein